jgi:hypothetical protein
VIPTAFGRDDLAVVELAIADGPAVIEKREIRLRFRLRRFLPSRLRQHRAFVGETVPQVEQPSVGTLDAPLRAGDDLRARRLRRNLPFAELGVDPEPAAVPRVARDEHRALKERNLAAVLLAEVGRRLEFRPDADGFLGVIPVPLHLPLIGFQRLDATVPHVGPLFVLCMTERALGAARPVFRRLPHLHGLAHAVVNPFLILPRAPLGVMADQNRLSAFEPLRHLIGCGLRPVRVGFSLLAVDVEPLRAFLRAIDERRIFVADLADHVSAALGADRETILAAFVARFVAVALLAPRGQFEEQILALRRPRRRDEKLLLRRPGKAGRLHARIGGSVQTRRRVQTQLVVLG